MLGLITRTARPGHHRGGVAEAGAEEVTCEGMLTQGLPFAVSPFLVIARAVCKHAVALVQTDCGVLGGAPQRVAS